MKRLLVLVVVFFFLFAVQFGLFASLPGWLALTPIIPAASISIAVHFGKREALWWIAAQGAFLDFFRLENQQLETFSYGVAAIAVFLCAKSIFSGRSLYGIFACGLVMILALFLAQNITVFLADIRDIRTVPWRVFFTDTWIRGILLFGLLAVNFSRPTLLRRFVNWYERN